MSYGQRLEAAMVYARKDRKSLCDAIGVTAQAVSQTIKGRPSGADRAFTANNNARAAAYLGVDQTWLATGEGSMIPVEPPGHPSNADLTAQALELGLLFDLVQGRVERAVVYNRVTAIILEQLDAATQPNVGQASAAKAGTQPV